MRNELDKTVRMLCLAFPRTEELSAHGSANYRIVGGKIFATYCVNHHGDGRVAVWCAASKDEQETLVSADPDFFFVPPYVGVGGWIGIRLDRDLDWGVIASLIAEGHRFILAKQGRRRSV